MVEIPKEIIQKAKDKFLGGDRVGNIYAWIALSEFLSNIREDVFDLSNIPDALSDDKVIEFAIEECERKGPAKLNDNPAAILQKIFETIQIIGMMSGDMHQHTSEIRQSVRELGDVIEKVEMGVGGLESSIKVVNSVATRNAEISVDIQQNVGGLRSASNTIEQNVESLGSSTIEIKRGVGTLGEASKKINEDLSVVIDGVKRVIGNTSMRSAIFMAVLTTVALGGVVNLGTSWIYDNYWSHDAAARRGTVRGVKKLSPRSTHNVLESKPQSLAASITESTNMNYPIAPPKPPKPPRPPKPPAPPEPPKPFQIK